MVTVMSPEGKPIQVDANVLNAAGAQNTIGTINIYKPNSSLNVEQELSISKVKEIF